MPLFNPTQLSDGTNGVLFDHFLASLSTTTPQGSMHMIGAVNGTGANVQGLTVPDATTIGILQCITGTTTTGRAGVLPNSTVNLRFGGGVLSTAWRFQIPTLLDGTESGAIYIGFGDSATGAPTDGAYLYWDNTQTNFRARTRSNSVETDTDLGVAPVAGTWYKIEITVNAAGTSAAFVLTPSGGGATTVINTTNIPTGSGRETGIFANIIKSAGTTSRILYLDYARLAWAGFAA